MTGCQVPLVGNLTRVPSTVRSGEDGLSSGRGICTSRQGQQNTREEPGGPGACRCEAPRSLRRSRTRSLVRRRCARDTVDEWPRLARTRRASPPQAAAIGSWLDNGRARRQMLQCACLSSRPLFRRSASIHGARPDIEHMILVVIHVCPRNSASRLMIAHGSPECPRRRVDVRARGKHPARWRRRRKKSARTERAKRRAPGRRSACVTCTSKRE